MSPKIHYLLKIDLKLHFICVSSILHAEKLLIIDEENWVRVCLRKITIIEVVGGTLF